MSDSSYNALHANDHRVPETWERVFMDIARTIAARSKDPSTQAGAVIVSPDNRILGLGFNGPPKQLDDETIPWQLRPQKYGYILHGEMNAILDALSKSKSDSLSGSRMFTTHKPCSLCTLFIVAMGIESVIIPISAKDHHVDEWTCIDHNDILARQHPMSPTYTNFHYRDV